MTYFHQDHTNNVHFVDVLVQLPKSLEFPSRAHAAFANQIPILFERQSHPQTIARECVRVCFCTSGNCNQCSFWSVQSYLNCTWEAKTISFSFANTIIINQIIGQKTDWVVFSKLWRQKGGQGYEVKNHEGRTTLQNRINIKKKRRLIYIIEYMIPKWRNLNL